MKILLSKYVLKHPLARIGWYVHYLMKELQAHNAIEQLSCVPTVRHGGNYVALKRNSLSSGIKKLIRAWPMLYLSLHYLRSI